jgi:hypothetical protein
VALHLKFLSPCMHESDKIFRLSDEGQVVEGLLVPEACECSKSVMEVLRRCPSRIAQSIAFGEPRRVFNESQRLPEHLWVGRLRPVDPRVLSLPPAEVDPP